MKIEEKYNEAKGEAEGVLPKAKKVEKKKEEKKKDKKDKKGEPEEPPKGPPGEPNLLAELNDVMQSERHEHLQLNLKEAIHMKNRLASHGVEVPLEVLTKGMSLPEDEIPPKRLQVWPTIGS